MFFFFFFFFFNDTATTEIYTLSLHDALPIYLVCFDGGSERESCKCINLDSWLSPCSPSPAVQRRIQVYALDRKSTRLNSSHSQISYAVFCLKKKKKTETINTS